MSYILDALRKAEEARSGKEPSLPSMQPQREPRRRRKAYWRYVLVGALALNAIIFAWRLGPRSGLETAHVAPAGGGHVAAVEAVKDGLEVGSIAQLPPVRKTNEESGENVVQGDAKAPQEARPVAVPRTAAEAAVKGKRSEGAPPVVARKPETSTQEHVSVSQPDRVTEHGDPQKIYRLAELPESLRKDLPDLSLALHYYTADPASRLVNISDRTLREGDEVAAGVKVEEITRNGAIFSCRNYRFRVGIHQ